MVNIILLDQNLFPNISLYTNIFKVSNLQQNSWNINLPDLKTDKDTVYDSPTSLANQLKSTLHFNQSQTYNRNTPTEYDPRPLPRQLIVSSIHHLPLQINNPLHKSSIEKNAHWKRIELLKSLRKHTWDLFSCSSKIFTSCFLKLELVSFYSGNYFNNLKSEKILITLKLKN